MTDAEKLAVLTEACEGAVRVFDDCYGNGTKLHLSVYGKDSVKEILESALCAVKGEELRPCPFCGGEVKVNCDGKGAHIFRCMGKETHGCNSEATFYLGRAEAVRRWNRRAGDE